MANSLNEQIDIFFDDTCIKFEAMNVVAKNCQKHYIEPGRLQQAGQTAYLPVDLMTETVDGRDVSSSKKDLTELTVPVTLTDAHIRNVPVSFTGVDLNSPNAMEDATDASAKMLSNKIDTLIVDEVVDKAALAVINSGSIDTQLKAAEADTMMLIQQVTKGMRNMFLNPYMSQNLVGDLAARSTLSGKPLTAYERSTLPPIAGFNTFRSDYVKQVTGSSGSGYLVNGANQHYTPVTHDANGVPVDNRTSTLTVDTGTGAAVGDVFTMPNVYAVGAVNKKAGQELRTFRITAINGNDWTVSPAIIPADGANQSQKDYATVSTTPADNAAITIKNTVTKSASIFCEKSAVRLVHSNYNLDAFRSTGKKVRYHKTDSGIQIVLLCDSNIDTLVADYRMFVWCKPEVINPLGAGIMLEGQT